MGHAAEAAQIQIPPVVFGLLAQLFNAGRKPVQTLFALRTADELADARHQHIHCGHGAPIVVLAHIKCFDFLGVIIHSHGPAKMILC